MPAVRAGRVHGVDPDFVNRPGPHLDEAAARLAALIHTDRDDPGSGARTGIPTTPGGSP
ncbi:MAG: hypothetical protein GWN71_27730 [Gammaproteobacteria bacterium]|nr:hypothetical protein [Gemmatimonadota bacterium]NIU77203.1 hypothetical protein [Gammaproteobacteria bacterium]